MPTVNRMRFWVLAVTAVFLFATLSACQTMGGLGRDVQSGGQILEEAAEGDD